MVRYFLDDRGVKREARKKGVDVLLRLTREAAGMQYGVTQF
jgi:hypothetical protein